MSDEIDYIDPAEFVDEGFLQEVNRRFLHPLGLALETDPDREPGEYAMRVWDYRDDPEGIAFVPPPDVDKARRVLDEHERHAQARRKRWGWVVQPVGVGLADGDDEPTDTP